MGKMTWNEFEVYMEEYCLPCNIYLMGCIPVMEDPHCQKCYSIIHKEDEFVEGVILPNGFEY